jgi:hypothetical protein
MILKRSWSGGRQVKRKGGRYDARPETGARTTGPRAAVHGEPAPMMAMNGHA